jgi:DNA-binding IclR family transcriptional regulator
MSLRLRVGLSSPHSALFLPPNRLFLLDNGQYGQYYPYIGVCSKYGELFIFPVRTGLIHPCKRALMNPLQKVFLILEEVVCRQDRGAGYSEIVTALDLPKSTVHRILKDLTELGYLTFNPESRRYFGSLRLSALGAEVMSHFQLRDHVRPHLLQMHRETDHTTNLGVIDGNVGVFVDKIESKDFGIKLFSEIGKTFPLHCTGMGKALLAFSAGKALASILASPLKAMTDKTITDADVFLKELGLIRERGYAIDSEEITRGIMCVAAPVFGFNGEAVCAISLTFPAYVDEDRGIEPEISAIRKYSTRISTSLGHGAPFGEGVNGHE